MICFWILKKGYENKKIFGKPALKSFTHLYFEDTGIPHITKVINQDPVNKNDQNFFLVLDSANLYSIIENDKYKKYQKEIDWCISQNIQIVFDRSWEWRNSNINLPFEYKVITNTTHATSNVIDAQWFPRYLSAYINYQDYNLLPKQVEKKYLYTTLFGEIRKPHRLMLLAGLEKENLLSFYTKFIRYTYTNFSYDYQNSKYYEYIKENWNDLISDKMFDMNTVQESKLMYGDKKIPEEFHESYFNIVVESTTEEHFYTEKTYKPIMVKIPFFIHGSQYQNQQLKNYLDLELYDEIFDYSFDSVADVHKRTEMIVEEVRRISKEPRSIFTQPKTTEKLEYNFNIYNKIAGKEYIQKELVKAFR
jgi:hypothetical protein